MRMYIPNSGHLINIEGFLRRMDPNDVTRLDVELHGRWVSVHPFVLSLVGCAGSLVNQNGGRVSAEIPPIGSLPYLVRMKLFDFLGVDPGIIVQEHEAAGRFIPLTQIQSTEELSAFLVDVVPLLHAQPGEAEPIKYLISELVRNVLEHSGSPVGAIVCAQYFKNTKRLAVAVADAGKGVLGSMRQFHPVRTEREAIRLALQPGITGTTSRLGGTEFNAGAGLFFTKAIAAASKNLFVIYSGDALFKLLKPQSDDIIYADPQYDRATWRSGLPPWPGTVVGIDIAVESHLMFAGVLQLIRKAYSLDLKAKRKAKYRKPRFV